MTPSDEFRPLVHVPLRSSATATLVTRGAASGVPARATPAAHPLRRRAAALVALLPDGDPAVRTALARLGKLAEPALRRAARGEDPEVRAHARAHLAAISRRTAIGRLMGYAACLDRGDRSGVTLERGLMLLDRALAPGRDMRPTCRRLDELGEALAERLRLRPPGPRRALAIVELLAGEEGFEGSDEDYRQPDNTSLARALVRRSGLPLTLCALYQAVARRAGVTAHLLPFPGHVLLELRDGSERYLVDAYGGGRLMQPRQCLAHLAVHGIPFRERWLTPATDGEMLARQVHNAVRALVQRGRGGESKGLAWALELLTPAAR